MSLSRRLREIEPKAAADEHCRYLIEFLKRSIHDGVYGRYLESRRRDGSAARPKFYANGQNGGNGQ